MAYDADLFCMNRPDDEKTVFLFGVVGVGEQNGVIVVENLPCSFKR